MQPASWREALARAWPLAVALRRQRRQRATQMATTQPLARGAALRMGRGEQSGAKDARRGHAVGGELRCRQYGAFILLLRRLALLEARDELVAFGKPQPFRQLQPLLGRLHAVQGRVQGRVHGDGAEV